MTSDGLRAFSGSSCVGLLVAFSVLAQGLCNPAPPVQRVAAEFREMLPEVTHTQASNDAHRIWYDFLQTGDTTGPLPYRSEPAITREFFSGSHSLNDARDNSNSQLRSSTTQYPSLPATVHLSDPNHLERTHSDTSTTKEVTHPVHLYEHEKVQKDTTPPPALPPFTSHDASSDTVSDHTTSLLVEEASSPSPRGPSSLPSSSTLEAAESSQHAQAPDPTSTHGEHVENLHHVELLSPASEALKNERERMTLRLLRVRRKRAKKAKLRADEPEETAPLVRYQAARDLEILSDLPFKLFERPNPQFDTIISSLRLGTSSSEAVISRPVPLGARTPKGNTLARMLFWRRKEVKQVILQRSEGEIVFLLSYVDQPHFLQPHPSPSYVGVWQIGSSDEPGEDLVALERRQNAVVQSYWLWEPRTGITNPDVSFVLAIHSSSDRDGRGQAQTLADLERTPDIESLLSSGQLHSILSRPVAGRHWYAYHPSPETSLMIREWTAAISTRLGAFHEIPLTPEQIQKLSINMSSVYFRRRSAKVVKRQTGEEYMLSFFNKVPWLTQYGSSVVAVWKVGPILQTRRLLILKGLYAVSNRQWAKMTPDLIPGLRESHSDDTVYSLP